MKESESCSVMSDSLWLRGLYSPWNSPGQNTGVGSLSLLRGYSQPRAQTQVSRIAGGFFTRWATREAWIILKMSTSDTSWNNCVTSRICVEKLYPPSKKKIRAVNEDGLIDLQKMHNGGIGNYHICSLCVCEKISTLFCFCFRHWSPIRFLSITFMPTCIYFSKQVGLGDSLPNH